MTLNLKKPVKTKKNNREGRCYELAYRHIFKQQEGTLIHAMVWSPILQRMIDHALVETETGYIYEPVLDRYFTKAYLYETYKIQELARYELTEAMVMALKHGTYGPWNKQEDK